MAMYLLQWLLRHREKPGLGFFRFPTQPIERRKRWIIAVKRKDWQPSKYTRICGEHFVSGEADSLP